MGVVLVSASVFLLSSLALLTHSYGEYALLHDRGCISIVSSVFNILISYSIPLGLRLG